MVSKVFSINNGHLEIENEIEKNIKIGEKRALNFAILNPYPHHDICVYQS
ncbi:MAG: hypothetical protein M3162_05935 [Thermoproteota archaeon]|nr:hypothetical protein [Thermoproteota archaeon]